MVILVGSRCIFRKAPVKKISLSEENILLVRGELEDRIGALSEIVRERVDEIFLCALYDRDIIDNYEDPTPYDYLKARAYAYSLATGERVYWLETAKFLCVTNKK